MADKREEQGLKELFEDKRSFLFDGEKFYIDNANIDEVRQADWVYSKTYNEALLAGVTTMAQMQDILEERGITGKKYEERRQELANMIDSKIAEMHAASSKEEKLRLAEEAEDLRNKLFRWNQRASGPASVTTESISDDARTEALTASMVKDSKGERVWRDYEDYKTTKKVGLAMMARYQVMLALNGIDPDFMAQTPEALVKKDLTALPEAETKVEAPASVKKKKS